MANRTLRIGRIFGIEIKLDYSWFIALGLVVWSLVSHYFPLTHPGWSTGIYWAMGVLTALLFFGSVLAHELAHSLVSQAHGVAVRDITLFIFGGVAQINEEPKSARGEFLMALAGPLTSLVVAGLFRLLWLVILPVSSQLHALAGWVSWINVGVALFNLIPGFPLDGGRVLRAAAWGITGNLRRATDVASRLGRVVATGFIFWGIWQIFGGNWANGVWIAFIGWFLDEAATASRRQVTVQDMLTGHTARQVMMTDCPRIARDLPLDVMVDRVALSSGRRCFPVMEDDRLLGLLTLHSIRGVPKHQWATTTVEDVMVPTGELEIVGPDDDLGTIFKQMAEDETSQFPVIENGNLLGMVARSNIMTFLRVRADLGL